MLDDGFARHLGRRMFDRLSQYSREGAHVNGAGPGHRGQNGPLVVGCDRDGLVRGRPRDGFDDGTDRTVEAVPGVARQDERKGESLLMQALSEQVSEAGRAGIAQRSEWIAGELGSARLRCGGGERVGEWLTYRPAQAGGGD